MQVTDRKWSDTDKFNRALQVPSVACSLSYPMEWGDIVEPVPLEDRPCQNGSCSKISQNVKIAQS